MATCTLFEEDEVYVNKQGKGYQFGLILENSEFFSSEDEDESERPEYCLKRGSVRIAWYPTGKETVVAENKVLLADRSLMPGDVVRRLIPGQESQSGFIMDMEVKCHLHVKRTNRYIYNVNSKDLEPLQKFESGQDVMLDSWLGKVEAVNSDVILLLPDGARCQVDEHDLCGFDDISDKVERHGEFGVCISYPGQELKGPLEHLSDGKWLHSTPRYCHKTACKKGRNSVHVTVEKIVTRNVEVQWVFRGFEVSADDSSPPKQPSSLVNNEKLERLQVLNWFEHCSLQIGDRLLYRVKNDDCISALEPSQAFNPNSLTDKSLNFAHILNGACSNETANGPVGSKDVEDLSEVYGQIPNEEEDCEYEDVDDDSDVEGDRTLASQNKGAGGRGAKKKGRSGFKAAGSKFKSGKLNQKGAGGSNRKKTARERLVNADDVVESEIVFTSSWATVMWQDGSMETDIPSIELFPVHHLDELEFFPGDFVLPNSELESNPDYGVVVKTDHHERTCVIHWFKAFDVSKEREPIMLDESCEMSVYDIKDHPDYKFRPGQCIVRVSGFEHIENDSDRKGQGVGQVIKLDPNGRLVVKWSNGSISQCFPQEIFIISDDGDDLSNNGSWDESDDETGSSSGETWETESEQEIFGEDEEDSKSDSGKANSSSLTEHKQELDSLLSRAQTALVRLQTLLNSFDISVSAPECFHDIIRIYRNCHDLDKILQSSFFSDPELQSLIAQAKLEIKRDKTNKISKHLSQLFESWSSSSTDTPNDYIRKLGTLAVGDKTIKVGTNTSGTAVTVTIEHPVDQPSSDGHTANEAAKAEFEESSTLSGDFAMAEQASSTQPSESEWEGHVLRKESSEPVINQLCRNEDPCGCRRPSDPVLEATGIGIGAKSKTKSMERNLVGENCVGKAPKRTKSELADDSGRDVKKSREDGDNKTHVAQELCFKICQNLQQQILKIHEEVNKRTKRLISSEEANTDDTTKASAEAVLPITAETAKDSSSTEESSSVAVNVLSVAEVSKEKDTICENGDGGETIKEDICKTDADSEETAVDAEDSNSVQVEESLDAIINAIPPEGFKLEDEVDACHKFSKQASQPPNPRSFRNAVKKEMNLFRSSLPNGIFVKGFEDRLDLYSVMILGPSGTPYEDALFLFDLMLPNDYPSSPPICHYHSYCTERLNPNLYEDGKVCVSLLGTWSGKGTEMWTCKSNLLQVLLSIQGLILVSEPYYNEAGYERQRGTQVGMENSRVYNEMAILKTVQSLTCMCRSLPTLFKEEVANYLVNRGPRMIARLRKWMENNQPNLPQATEPSSDGSCLQNSTAASSDLSCESSQYPSTSVPPKENEAFTDKFSKLQVTHGQNASSVNTGDCVKDGHHLSQPLQNNDAADCSNVKYSPQENVNEKTPTTAHPSEKTLPGDAVVPVAAGGSLEDERDKDSALSQNSPSNDRPKERALTSQFSKPDFPLLPMSRGFRLTLQKTLNTYEQALKKLKDSHIS